MIISKFRSPLRCQLRKPFRVDPADGCAVVPCREIRPPGAHGLHILPRAESERWQDAVGSPPDRYFTSHLSFHLR